MKKLTLATLISGMFAFGALAADDVDPIESTFAALDNDENGYISREEADDDDIIDFFARMDTNSDNRISHAEYDNFKSSTPEAFEADLLTASAQTEAEIEMREQHMDGEDKTNVLVTQTEKVETTRELTTMDSEVEAKVETDFMKMDADRDGEIARNEAEQPEVLENFDEIDTNDDHVITRVEYQSYVIGEYNDDY